MGSWQSFRNNANALLGGLRPSGPRELRAGRHQGVYEVLGNVDVRHLFRHKYRRSAESPHRHDESFLSVDFRKYKITHHFNYTCLMYMLII